MTLCGKENVKDNIKEKDAENLKKTVSINVFSI